MAKEKAIVNEREYIINLRREILKVPRHKRTPKAIKAIKKFIAKHMRIPDRDTSKIKIDKYLNEELWFRGIKNPITKVKVKVKRDGDLIRVELVELSDKVKFIIARKKKIEEATKKDKKTKEKAEEKKKEEGKDEKKDEKTEEEKKDEKEKAEASKEAKTKQSQKEAKEAKHTQISKQAKSQPIRKALKK